jgi:protein-tyrosine phosphatase
MLPGVDDGPETLEEALAMARLAVANGIRRTVLTPHVHPGRYPNEAVTIQAAAEAFAGALAEAGIPLALGVAAEVRIGPEVMALITEGRVPWLGALDGERLLLLELPHSHVPPGAERFMRWCVRQGVRPVIPHPERNKDVIRRLDKLDPLLAEGCLLQVTAGSVAGAFGPQAERRALELLEAGLVFLLGSDAHNTDHRPPELEPGRAAAARIVGEDASWDLVRGTPERIGWGLGP